MKKTLVILIAAAMAVSLAGCGKPSGTNKETAGTVTDNGGGAAASPRAKDEMVAGIAGLSTAIDPMLANYYSTSSIGLHIYNTLVAYDKDSNIIPEMASEWSRTDDLTWEFTVELDQYKFHNGDPVTMDDVVFSVERCLEIPQAMDFVSGVASVTGEGNTLTVKTEAPNNKLIHGFTNIVITSKKAVTEAGDNWGQTAVGTGPYKLVSFVPSNEAVIERWDEHPNLKPALRKITFRAIADSTSRYIGIENGDLDFVDRVMGAGDIGRAQSNENLNTEIVHTFGLRFMAVNAQKEPFNHPNVREALQYTIDRPSLIELTNGIDQPANTMLSGVLAAHNADVTVGELDLDKAKALLAEAGYANGFDTTLWIYNDSWKSTAELMQAMLAQVGVKVTIEQYEVGAFFDLVDKGQHMMLLGSQTASPYYVANLNQYYNDEFFGSSGNFGFYKNDQAIELIEQALATRKPEEEITLCKEVQQLVAKDNPYFPISYNSDCMAVVKNLKGYDFYPSSQWSFLNAYFE